MKSNLIKNNFLISSLFLFLIGICGYFMSNLLFLSFWHDELFQIWTLGFDYLEIINIHSGEEANYPSVSPLYKFFLENLYLFNLENLVLINKFLNFQQFFNNKGLFFAIYALSCFISIISNFNSLIKDEYSFCLNISNI